MQTGGFALFPGTVPHAGLSDTCSSVHSSGRTVLRQTATAVPSLLAPRASFAAREAPWRAAGAGVGQEGLFLEFIPLLLGVLRRGPEDLLVAQRGSGENLGSGFCLGVQAGL